MFLLFALGYLLLGPLVFLISRCHAVMLIHTQNKQHYSMEWHRQSVDLKACPGIAGNHILNLVSQQCHGLGILQLQRSRIMSNVCFKTVLSETCKASSHGHKRWQPPTSCEEQQKTCTKPSKSWQNVDRGSTYSWLSKDPPPPPPPPPPSKMTTVISIFTWIFHKVKRSQANLTMPKPAIVYKNTPELQDCRKFTNYYIGR